jgi:hypothetical protein
LNWLKALVLSSGLLLIGCSQHKIEVIEECEEIPVVNLDSLFRIGDSVLENLYIKHEQQRTSMDSLNISLSDYQGKLINREKVESEIRNRIIYKDTIVYRQKVQTVYTTVRDTIYITDTIRDTVYVKKRKKKRR